ncbi:hypothetical protein BUALT_Bualt19G0080400 [Buddleja alternifolia]|uniref:Glycosyltransferase N-terminal domain-containing protein n=1 Tax=Buddleja alternifolia TaxID=168488 RepID=A0AAV6W267_9LAMI|nr:hypothetical protein BUALT_Bualt19G0080400 [Buddleja alternifolia]
MGSIVKNEYKPHAVCIPYPAQGHVNPMLKLAKLLHHNGFHITFVNTEYNHRRLLKSHGGYALEGLPDFRFATIPDGLPPSDADATQDIPSLCESTTKTCLEPFCELLTELNSSDAPPVSCIVSDGVMSFTVKAAERFGLPEVLFWTTSACGLLGYTQYRNLVEKGYTPLQDMSQITNGYLETIIDWIPGMKDIRLRDLPTFIRTTNPKDIMLNFVLQEIEAIPSAKALILNTFDVLEQEVLDALSAICVDWEIGMEIDNDVKRDDVELMVKEMMDGEKGKKMKEKAGEWKRKAEEAVALGGSSYLNLNKLINEVLLQ